MSAPTVAERVAAGVKWLDKQAPLWWRRVDLERLDVGSCAHCVLGQLFGNFQAAPESAVGKGAAPSFGFAKTNVERLSAYRALTAEWVRVIEERRTQMAGAR